MPQYKVKDGFYLHKGEQCHLPGAVVELTEAEAGQFAAQVEQITVPAKEKAKKINE